MKARDAIVKLIAESGYTQAEIARMTGVTEVSISRWKRERHPSGVRPSNVRRIALALGYSVKWLNDEKTECEFIEIEGFQSFDPMAMPAEEGFIPVISIAEAGKGIWSTDGDYPAGGASEYISRPHGLKDHNAYGLVVEGDSMLPSLKQGMKVICSPNLEATSGDLAVIRLKDGRAMLAEIRYDTDNVRLIKHNPKFQSVHISSTEVEFIHPIIWVRRR